MATLKANSVERPEQIVGFIRNLLQNSSELNEDQKLIVEAAFQALFRQVQEAEAYASFGDRFKEPEERLADGLVFLANKLAEHSVEAFERSFETSQSPKCFPVC
jgi:hypothetical protein